MEKPLHSTRHSSSSYHNIDEQLQQWQKFKRMSEGSHVVPQKSFTQVTTAAYQRKNSCHGDLSITHHKSDTDRQRGDFVRSPICNENSRGKQYKTFRARSYHNQVDPINTIDQKHCSPPMLCNTPSYLSRPHHSEPCWTNYSFSRQDHILGSERAHFSPIDGASPYVAVGLPLTPADTIQAEDLPPKRSLNNSGTAIESPAYKSESGSYEVVPGLNAKLLDLAEVAVEEPQHNQNRFTPPPETIACPTGRTNHTFDGNLQAAGTDIKHEACQDADTKEDDTNYAEFSIAPVVGEDSDLGFLPSNWDPNNFDFLDDENGWAPSFMSQQEQTWDTRHIVPSAYPALAPDSGYSTDVGIGTTSFQPHPTFASEPLDYQFDQFGAYLPAQSSFNELDTFHSSFHPCDTPFSTQPSSTGQANDRTSKRSKSKDQMLVDLKQRGYSYKDIKVMGQFEEAESTLRGRYRTLTKPKEARVRKPEWGDREVRLKLCHLNKRFILT
jgi:hypothetical protein